MKKKYGNMACSVARSLDILGDRWVFLILRDAFFKVRHYDQFLANLGIATNILSNRLKLLVGNGIMERESDADDARRIKYKLTEKGLDLYPIILAFIKWGDRWLADEDGPPLILHHKSCGHSLTPLMCCEHCREAVNARDVIYASSDFPGHDS